MALITDEDRLNSNNTRRTKSLFKEFAISPAYVKFTVADNPVSDMIPLKSIYLGMCVEDPTEHDFATYVFGEYKHWTEITECGWMKPIIEDWRDEADVIRKKRAFKTLVSNSSNNNAAARYLIEEPWKVGTKAKKNSKATTDKAAQSIAGDVKRLKDFM